MTAPMTAPTTGEPAATVLELLPEVDDIRDPALRDAVLRIWTRAWESSAWQQLHEVPKSIELPTKRTLVTHTRAVTRITDRMVDVARDLHGVAVSKDKALAIALLHDVSKIHEFERGATGPRYSRVGRIYQHAFLGAHWMAEEGLDEELIHAVIAHTPLSAVVPQTHEAVIVHYADFADSDVQLLDAGRTLFCKRGT